MSNNKQLFTEILSTEEAKLSGGFGSSTRSGETANISGSTINGGVNITLVTLGVPKLGLFRRKKSRGKKC